VRSYAAVCTLIDMLQSRLPYHVLLTNVQPLFLSPHPIRFLGHLQARQITTAHFSFFKTVGMLPRLRSSPLPEVCKLIRYSLQSAHDVLIVNKRHRIQAPPYLSNYWQELEGMARSA